MSAVSVVVNFTGELVHQNLLDKMIQEGVTPLQDYSDTLIKDHLAFGFNAVNATPESQNERQPFVHQNQPIILVADARLDNRDELIPLLYSKEFIQSKNPTDAELICAAYLCWGELHARYLIGDFAYVLYDDREKKLLCVRDPFGTKPLFYTHRPGKSIVLASSIKQIFAAGELPVEIRDEAIAYWLTWQPYDFLTQNTFFKDIYQVKPAHLLMVNAEGKLHEQRFLGC